MVWRLCRALPLALLAAYAAEDIARVTLSTQIGEIVLEINRKQAPITAANFLRYVEKGAYDGGRFHRTVTMSNQPNNAVKIEVIQAAARRDALFEPIKLERTTVTGLRHRDGAISMARDEPDTARDQFFICIGDQPELDFGGKRNPDGQGFAAFGRVVSGMEVVRRIQRSKAAQQSLDPTIEIRTARILK